MTQGITSRPTFSFCFIGGLLVATDHLLEQRGSDTQTKRTCDVTVYCCLVQLGIYPVDTDFVEYLETVLHHLSFLFREATVLHQSVPSALVSQCKGGCFGFTTKNFVLGLNAVDRRHRVRVDVWHLLTKITVSSKAVTVITVGVYLQFVRILGSQC